MTDVKAGVRQYRSIQARGSLRRGASTVPSVILLVLLLVLFTPSAWGQRIGDAAQREIATVLAEKRALTGDQRKIASLLLQAERAVDPQRAREGRQVPLQVTEFLAAKVDANSAAQVTIRGEVTARLLTTMRALGATEIESYEQFDAITARLPLLALRSLAALPEVRSISPLEKAVVRQQRVGPRTSVTHERVPYKSFVRGDLITPQVGSVTSQGVVAHAADRAHQTGILGSGRFVCVMSNGIMTLASRQATSDLPTVYVLAGQAGPPTLDEGTAMLEIVHDMAPGATLGFATASGSRFTMAQNILNLRNAGCNVIVDDIGYPNEGVFQDDVIANAITNVASTGVLFVSAAGNDGNLTHNTSGTWQGDWQDSGFTIVDNGFNVPTQQFGSLPFNQLLVSPAQIALRWSDPLGASTNDYDLFVLDPSGSVVLSWSLNPQTGTQDPFEFINCTPALCPAGGLVVVAKYSGLARALNLQALLGPCGQVPCLSVPTAGATYGHPATPAAIGVGAVNVATAGGGVFVGGAVSPVEPFSSDGPSRRFYYSNGTPITPGNYLFATNGGATVAKVDIAAADRGSTSTPGFNPFPGTSAAAPHAAAIASLVWSANPSLPAASVVQAMRNTALDIEAPGFDRDSGVGIVMAAPAVRSVLTPLTIGASFTPATIPPGSTANYAITFSNPNSVPLQGVAFTSTYPAAIRNSGTPNPGGSGNGCGGTLIAAPSGGSFAMTDGFMPALGTCTVYVTVTSSVAGLHTANTGILTTPIALNTAGASAQLAVNVTRQPSAVGVISSANPVFFGQSVTFTATVTGGGPVPTGSVTFSDGATPICSNVALNGAGQAGCLTSNLSIAGSPHAINVAYGGDSNYLASAGSLSGGQTVNRVPTSTGLASSQPSIIAGAQLTLTATVVGLAPTGTVNFTRSGESLSGCGAVAIGGTGNTRTAQCVSTTLPVGTYPLSAQYSGDATNDTSTGSVSQTVEAACAAFNDVPASSLFCPNVEWLKNRAVTLGCTTTEYCPTSVVSRLSMAAFMNRLGTALTPRLLWSQQSPGAVDLDGGAIVCQTADFVVAGFPRRAKVDFTFAGTAIADADFQAEAVITFDSGAIWTTPGFTPSVTAISANHWAAVKGSRTFDMSVGQTARFGVRVTRSGGSTADLSASDCAIRVLIGSRDGTTSPYDVH